MSAETRAEAVAPETPIDALARWEREGFAAPACEGCREVYNAVAQGQHPSRVFAPRHKPSDRCESGKRPHCACDTCF